MTGPGAALAERVGGRVSEAFGLDCVDVPAQAWQDALFAARDGCGLTYFDWLSAVDELDDGFAVVVHLADPGPPLRHLLIRTVVTRADPRLPTATGAFAGAAWHERETAEMYGVVFDGHPNPAPLLLPDGFAGHPLRKDFVLASRVVKEWPGAKEPGGERPRRRTRPPGVPADWRPGDG